MTNPLPTLDLNKRLGGRNLFLVGMMGSGKSSTGPFLAQALGYGYVDSDSLIEKIAGKAIPAIFEEDKEEGFREIETKVLNAIGERHSLVVSTGGGIVIKSENWGVLHQGIVIWLNPSKERLFKRLEFDQSNRPLLKGLDFRNSLDDLCNQRNKYYSEADLHLSIDDESPEQVARKILLELPKIIRDQNDLV